MAARHIASIGSASRGREHGRGSDDFPDIWEDDISEGDAAAMGELLEQEGGDQSSKDEEEAENRETGNVQDYLRRKSNVARIQTAAEAYMQKATNLLRYQDPHLISRSIFADVCKSQRRQFYGCLSLPFSIFCFGSFAYSVYLRGDITNVYIVESGLLGILSNDSQNVETIPQLWDWLEGVLIPTAFQQTDPYGQPIEDKKLWSTVLGYNHLTGPLVLEQLRSEVGLCGNGPDSIGADMACYPRDSESRKPLTTWDSNFNVTPPAAEDVASGTALPTVAQRLHYWQLAGISSSVESDDDNNGIGRRLRNMRPELRRDLKVQTTMSYAYSAYIFPTTRLVLIREHLDYLKRGHWLDQQTKQLRVRALFLNAEMGRPRLTQFQLVFAISRAGGIFVRATCETLFLEYWPAWYFYVADLVWILALSIVTAKHVRSLAVARRIHKLQAHMRSFSFLLNWLIIFGGWVIFSFNVFQVLRTNTIVEAYRVVATAQQEDKAAELNLSAGKNLQYQVDWMTYFNSWFRVFEALYHLLLMIRFFISFRTQPRLGVVISTLEASLIDVVHCLMVVLPMFAAYAISGCFIFGRRIEGFKSFESAAGTCFKIFMENQYNWQELTEEHYWTAAIWTWSFMFILVMLMLNMVLAIVLDVYAEIRKNSGQSESVWVTFMNILTRLRFQKEWISHKTLLERSKSMSQMISREELLRTFPLIRNRQLNMLLLACRFRKDMAMHGDDGSFKDTMKMTRSLKLVADKMEELVRNLDEGTSTSDKQTPRTSEGIAGDDWMMGIATEMASQNHSMLSVQWQLQQLDWQVQAFEMTHRPHEISSEIQKNAKRGDI